ncbi:MAG: alkaline phosphatase family protein [Opitutaceae bacterium]|nr:alkaline phosphatase family protein [Opitutaceae bacterium]
MRFLSVFLFTLIGLAGAARAAETPWHPLIVIALDGFGANYTEKFAAESPTLRTLRREGASVRGLIPSFPSNTFPNLYTLVTGLYPARHGIVNNDFFDPESGQFFHYNQPATALHPRWWGGEPIWVTAIKQGRKSATAFWVGNEVPIGGIRPTFWQRFDYSVPFERRLDDLMSWLTLPAAERPAVVTFYLEETNSAGHRFGPDSAELAAAVRLVDGRIATLLARVRAANLEPNLVITSDHGMTATSVDRVVLLDDLLDRNSVQIESEGSVLALRPLQGDAATLIRKLAGVPHVRAYLAEDLPARFRFRDNARIAPVWVLPEEGWHIGTRANFERLKSRYKERGYLAGDHGYDPALPSMHGILIAHGPAFRRGVEAPAAENIHVYPLLCAVLGLQPAPVDGDDRLVRALLRTGP